MTTGSEGETRPTPPPGAGGRSALKNRWRPDDPWVEAALREATLSNLRLVYHSSNYVFVADLDHPEHGQGLGVYKPARGEQPLWDFPDDLYRREIAAYEFAKLLGWRVVPPTVEAVGEHGVGSLQLFIEHDPREHYFRLREVDDYDWQLMRFAVFDLVVNNADRKAGHLLLDPQGRIWGIDNGLAFHAEEKFRTVIWDYAGSEVPREWLDDLERVGALLDSGAEAASTVVSLLLPVEVAALRQRIAAMIARPVLPDVESFERRVVPWPMI